MKLLVMTNISQKLIFRWMHDPALKIRIIPSMKTVSPVVPMIHHSPWNQKAANQTYEAVFPLPSSSVQKWNGSTTRWLKKPIDNAFVKNRVLHLNVDVWSTFIQRKTCVLIPERFAEPKNGITPIMICIKRLWVSLRCWETQLYYPIILTFFI